MFIVAPSSFAHALPLRRRTAPFVAAVSASQQQKLLFLRSWALNNPVLSISETRASSALSALVVTNFGIIDLVPIDYERLLDIYGWTILPLCPRPYAAEQCLSCRRLNTTNLLLQPNSAPRDSGSDSRTHQSFSTIIS